MTTKGHTVQKRRVPSCSVLPPPGRDGEKRVLDYSVLLGTVIPENRHKTHKQQTKNKHNSTNKQTACQDPRCFEGSLKNKLLLLDDSSVTVSHQKPLNPDTASLGMPLEEQLDSRRSNWRESLVRDLVVGS